MNRPAGRRPLILLLVLGGALVACAGAGAHAHVSPSVALSDGQVYTVVVPTEKDDAATTAVELTPPDGFSIGSFQDVPGWTRKVETSGSGEDAVVEKVTWSGGSVEEGGAAMFSFYGRPSEQKTYSFAVRQTYSDGEVVDWSGSESSDTPAPTVEITDALGGGGGGNSTLEIVAIVLAALALVVAGAALLTRSGKRSLA
jgi:uncharacterized protein YcnI